jgi:hypothetical protein
LLAGGGARATDEIQVYNAEIAKPGEWTLQFHNNYVPVGRTEPEFRRGLIPEGTLNGTPELAYGVTPWCELGAYAPYALTRDGSFEPGGAKLRTLFVTPDAAQRTFFYGLNTELSWSRPQFSDTRWNVELRPIVGIRMAPIEFIVNPIVDFPIADNPDFTFAPAVRLGWILSESWTVALEHYTDLGPIGSFASPGRQLHELFAVVDYGGGPVDVNFGLGRGLTQSSDDWTIKAIVGFSF